MGEPIEMAADSWYVLGTRDVESSFFVGLRLWDFEKLGLPTPHPC